MNRTTVIALLAGTIALAGCGESASKSARDNAAMDQTSSGMSPAGMVPTDIAPSPDLPTAPAVPGNPLVPADPAAPSSGTVTPPADDAAYNRGAGNANVGPGNDGSAGTMPSGSNAETNESRRTPPQ